ncbi:hypothetical protein HA397_27540, partial [Escherichia coli]|nr:hypothetical protein [Escherichia coli]
RLEIAFSAQKRAAYQRLCDMGACAQRGQQQHRKRQPERQGYFLAQH